MWRAVACLLLLLSSASAFAQDDICARTASNFRWGVAHNQFVLPPTVKALLLDIADGDRSAVPGNIREMHAAFDAKQMSRWLNWALLEATYFNQASIAESLVAHGADVNAAPLQPAFTGDNRPPQKMWPPLEQAADCGNTAALEVLLRHGADMYASIHQPEQMPGTLLLAIINKHERVVNVLLDHGYDPCLMRANYYPGPTAAEMAKRDGLSEAVIRRVSALSSKCASPASAHSSSKQ
jgi:hypothetical protein